MPRTGLTALEIKSKAVDEASAMMREVGFDKVRLTDVAKRLGVSHAALYAHFEDKAALFDAVSERWLTQIDDNLAAICSKRGNPADKIVEWMVAFHRAKLAKVQHDPELYKSFDLTANLKKPYVRRHMDAVRSQLVGLATEAIAKRRLRSADPEAIATVLYEATMGFHHPKLVALYAHEAREPLLRAVVDSVLKGLNLR